MTYGLSQDESPDEDKLMKDDLDDADKLVFDFEAYPMYDGDKEGLVNLLTQVFFDVSHSKSNFELTIN